VNSKVSKNFPALVISKNQFQPAQVSPNYNSKQKLLSSISKNKSMNVSLNCKLNSKTTDARHAGETVEYGVTKLTKHTLKKLANEKFGHSIKAHN